MSSMASPQGRAHFHGNRRGVYHPHRVHSSSQPPLTHTADFSTRKEWHRYSPGPHQVKSRGHKGVDTETLTTENESSLKTQSEQLPIYKIKDDLLRAIHLSDRVIITAETGAGKSTQIPQMLIEAGYSVIMTQPRRLAASAIASRIAEERAEPLGKKVGFRHALEDSVGSQSQLVVSTDGYEFHRFLHRASENDVLIIDEYHERNQWMDALIALHEKRLKTFYDGKGPCPPKLIIMSATINADQLSQRWGAPVLEAQGRAYPIIQVSPGASIEDDVIDETLDGKNTLVFLPGKAEIRALQTQLERENIDAEIIPLHSQLTSEEQNLVFPSYPLPKDVLSTNIAETSLTIPDVDTVIDSGLERYVELRDGIETLSIHPISKFNVRQRMGRGGRCGPGKYIYHGHVPYDQLEEFPKPEICRGPLEKLTLSLLAGGEDIEHLPFVDAPPLEHIELAKQSLYHLNLIGPRGHLTEEGAKVAALPVDVRTGKMLVKAMELDAKFPGLLENMIDIAAIIEAEGIIIPDKRAKWSRYCAGEHDSDHIAQLRIYRAAQYRSENKSLESMGIDSKSFRRAEEMRRLLDRRLDIGTRPEELQLTPSDTMRQKMLECIWTGMSDSVFRNVGTNGSDSMWKGLHSRGDRKLSRTSVVHGANLIIGKAFDLVVLREHDETKTLPLVLMATSIDPKWLMKHATPQLKRELAEPVAKANQRENRKRATNIYPRGRRGRRE
ncbi:MAG: ATP-dependent RNA helicase [Bdellovibrionales bacterium]|nr:ATP-dependent RNA helicase [Bdellovibrionales bacterium]